MTSAPLSTLTGSPLSQTFGRPLVDAVWQACITGLIVGLLSQPRTPQESEKPWRAAGRVTDGEGIPVAGAVVRAHCGMGTLRETGRATTDQQGKYDLQFGPGIWSDDEVNLQAATISVQLSGHFEKNLHRQGDLLAANRLPDGEIGWGGKTEADIFLPGQPKTIDFELLPSARLRGTLIDRDGNKLEGMRVSLTGDDLPPSSSVMAQATSDGSGRFEIDDIPTGYKFQLLVEPVKAEPPWLAWAAAPVEFALDESDNDVHLRYSGAHGVSDFSTHKLTLQLNGDGRPWKDALDAARSRTIHPKYDGLATAAGGETIIRSGFAVIELGE